MHRDIMAAQRPQSRTQDITSRQFRQRLMTIPRGVLNEFGLLINIGVHVASAPTKAVAVDRIATRIATMISAQRIHGHVTADGVLLTYRRAWQIVRELHRSEM